MKSKVRVSKYALDYFRKLARKTPLEIQAYLVGKVISPELVIVSSFKYPERYSDQTTNSVNWYLDEFEEVKKIAEEQGNRIVGDIHSHPSWDAVLSPTDYKAHVQSGFRISGICSTMTNRTGIHTRVRFWIAESCLPLEIEYDQEKS